MAARAGAAADGFDLDPFQREAIDAIDAGRSVLVAAPTGSGKTVVAEHAVATALARGDGSRAFYTTPIKALSNQKYHDLVRRHGADQVGLLTGDNAVNGDAPVVVMTTEVLRNMVYAASPALDRLRFVVLDEVHYLQDAYRGPVWEEVMIHLPPEVRLVCLSATVSNAHELADWIGTIRGPTATVIEHERPVELANLFLVGDKETSSLSLLPTLVDGRPNPEGDRFDAEQPRHGPRRGRPRRRWFTPRRLEVVDELLSREMLPAIYFIFSRNACDDAAAHLLDAGVALTTADERARIGRIVDQRLAALGADDLAVLGEPRFRAGLEAGVAPHHAGMVPPFKEAVEACFVEGLVKVVFATETLALGINMPARTVVIEKLSKFTGDHHELLTPGQYTQITGRAGRRGIDPIGHAVVLWSPFVSFGQVAGLAASRTFELSSAFRPTYNMAANLVRRYPPDEAHHLLNRSFAQYRADRDVVRLEARLDARRAAWSEQRDAATCERGDVDEYRALLPDRASRRGAAPRGIIEAALAGLHPGDVIPADGEDRVLVLSVAHRQRGAVRVRAITTGRKVLTLGAPDFARPPEVVARVEAAWRPCAPNNDKFRRAAVEQLRQVGPTGSGARRRGPRRRGPGVVDHPVAGAPTPTPTSPPPAGLSASPGGGRPGAPGPGRTGSLARQFDRVLAILEEAQVPRRMVAHLAARCSAASTTRATC
ncbi:MAG: DEAD/DEAH box helicase [Microthrixaceae bacterium]|nr:DEAD/DEAH box helicase [Microthrixaceae bacterium]